MSSYKSSPDGLSLVTEESSNGHLDVYEENILCTQVCKMAQKKGTKESLRRNCHSIRRENLDAVVDIF